MTTIYLRKKDVQKILEVMDKFPIDDNSAYKLEYDSYSIGDCLDMIIDSKINDVEGQFRVEIFGSGEW